MRKKSKKIIEKKKTTTETITITEITETEDKKNRLKEIIIGVIISFIPIPDSLSEIINFVTSYK